MPAWLKRNTFRLIALAIVAGLVLEARHALMGIHPANRSTVQRVTLLNPRSEPPRRPPAPEVKPPPMEQPRPAEPRPELSQPFQKFEDFAPGGDEGPPGPRDDLLGLDTEGAGAGDSFGLVGKRGGQDITSLGNAAGHGGTGGGGGHGTGHGGAMARFAPYAISLKDLMASELNRHGNLRSANYDAIVAVWIDPDGRIKRVVVTKSTGMPQIDEEIHRVLATAPILTRPPPEDMPQPVDLRIVSRGAVAGD